MKIKMWIIHHDELKPHTLLPLRRCIGMCWLLIFVRWSQLSRELTLKVEVVRPFNKPQPQPSPEQDDWIGCVSPATTSGLIAAGLYNGSVCVARVPAGVGSAESESMIASVDKSMVSEAEHEAAVKGVDILGLGVDGKYMLVSSSKDCSLRCWDYSTRGSTGPRCTAVCDGHADSVDCVSFSPSGAGDDCAKFASGSWDKTVKLWEAPLASGKAKTPQVLEPIASMDGHTQAVSCLCWRTGDTIYR